MCKECKLRYSTCKLIVEGEGMQFHCSSSLGLREWMEIIKEFEMIMCHGLPHIVSILNGHIALCGE
jgi:hypothetical protein